jgi:6-phospho-3-hexuloisomerase
MATTETHEVTIRTFTPTTSMILGELERALRQVSETQVSAAIEALLAAPRIFVTGAGRSGLAIKMIAMRLMHLGLQVHVVGETTTPAITSGDLLLVASGSGTTAGAVRAAETAKRVGANTLLLTTAPASRLGDLARWIVEIPAATKQDHGGSISRQYAGALFEQAVLLTMDAAFQQMWQSSAATAEELYTRHANIE